MAHKSAPSSISIALFKTQQNSGKFGQFSNTTPDDDNTGMSLTVKQTVEGEDLKTSTDFEWRSAERAYHAQKVIYLLKTIRSRMKSSHQLGDDIKFWALGLEMLRAIEKGGITTNGEFLPRERGNPNAGYEGIVRDYVPRLKQHSKELSDAVVFEKNKEGVNSQNASVFAFAKLAEANGKIPAHRAKNIERMKLVCQLKQKTNPEFKKLVVQCLEQGIVPCEISRHDNLWAVPDNELGLLHLEVALEELEKRADFQQRVSDGRYKITNVRAIWNQLRINVTPQHLSHDYLKQYEGQVLQLQSDNTFILIQEGNHVVANKRQYSNDVQQKFAQCRREQREGFVQARTFRGEQKFDIILENGSTQKNGDQIIQFLRTHGLDVHYIQCRPINRDETRYFGQGCYTGHWKVTLSEGQAKQVFSPEELLTLKFAQCRREQREGFVQARTFRGEQKFDIILENGSTQKNGDQIIQFLRTHGLDVHYIQCRPINRDETRYFGQGCYTGHWKVTLSEGQAKQVFSPKEFQKLLKQQQSARTSDTTAHLFSSQRGMGGARFSSSNSSTTGSTSYRK